MRAEPGRGPERTGEPDEPRENPGGSGEGAGRGRGGTQGDAQGAPAGRPGTKEGPGGAREWLGGDRGTRPMYMLIHFIVNQQVLQNCFHVPIKLTHDAC